MNQYGAKARAHWLRYAPSRVAALPDPTEFFQNLGSEVQAQVVELSAILAGTDPLRETYLQKVARLQAARVQAEEVVMAQLVWITDPELPLDEAREEWEQTRPSDENLISWAERMQDSQDLMPSTVELEQMASDWAVSVDFLEQLIQADLPREFLAQNKATMAEAATIRFMRELR